MITIIAASVLISLIFAPLGCVVLWKKYVYFGDGLSHASLLAGSISIISGAPIIFSGFIVAIFFAISVFKLKKTSGGNPVINLVSTSMLSLALILAYLNPSQINIDYLLFGDIISASINDMVVLSVILLMVICFITIFYHKIALIVLNRDIAKIRGVRVDSIELIFLLLLAFAVFSTIKIVGALLVTSLLLIPSMTARLIAATPFRMIITSVIIALISNLLGLAASFYFDMPTAPIMVIIGTFLYFIVYMLKSKQEFAN